MKKLWFLIVYLVIFPLLASAQQQSISVKSFNVDDNDLTANTNPVYDHNNQKCALIIVSNIGEGGYRFDAGNSYLKVEEKELNGIPVYLLWVSDGTRRISIYNSDSDILPLQNYAFNLPIKKAKTYFLELGEILKSSRSSKQYLTFVISPVVHGIAIEVDDIPWSLNSGRASNLVDAGQHTYRISAPEYNTFAGIIETQRADGNKDVTIHLVPQFGWLNIDGGTLMNDAETFIDGLSIGTGNVKDYKLNHGTYVVKIVKPHYKLYQASVTIKDDETVTLKPQFLNDASDVTISTNKAASLYIDGEFVGNGNWNGPLEIGQYIIESRLANHKNVKQSITVSEINKKLNFTLKEHEPILTSLSIESNPIGAKIYIDGKEMGVTPYHLNDILIGSHKIAISKEGYNSYEKDIILKEDNNNKIVAHLDNNAKVRFESNPSNSALYINSRYVGQTPYTAEFAKGTTLDIEIRKDGYKPYQTRITASNSDTQTYNLNAITSCSINGTSGGRVYIDERYAGNVPYVLTGESGERHDVEITWAGERIKKKKKTITLGKDTQFYGTKEQHRNRGKQAANIILTCCLPTLGWLSWILNPVSD